MRYGVSNAHSQLPSPPAVGYRSLPPFPSTPIFTPFALQNPNVNFGGQDFSLPVRTVEGRECGGGVVHGGWSAVLSCGREIRRVDVNSREMYRFYATCILWGVFYTGVYFVRLLRSPLPPADQSRRTSLVGGIT